MCYVNEQSCYYLTVLNGWRTSEVPSHHRDVANDIMHAYVSTQRALQLLLPRPPVPGAQ